VIEAVAMHKRGSAFVSVDAVQDSRDWPMCDEHHAAMTPMLNYGTFNSPQLQPAPLSETGFQVFVCLTCALANDPDTQPVSDVGPETSTP
jgi:hypothetical protein